MVATLKEQMNARRDEKDARQKKTSKKKAVKARKRADDKNEKKRKAARKDAREAESPIEHAARQDIASVKRQSTRIRKEWERAQEELAKRELARRHLLPFIQRFDPTYKAGWFHKDLCQRLERFSQDVVDLKEPRLMLFVPPRHGKSITSSQNFPAWHLGRNPTHEFISTSYAETLQTDFSKKVQTMIRSEEYQQLFPGLIIPKNHEAVSRWQLAQKNAHGGFKLTGGGLLAAGVGGPLTGRGAHIGLIDDPIKNAEEADSETIRQSIKNWYSSTFYTRMAPGGGILIIQTRWHDDDLSGWLINAMIEAVKEEVESGEWPEDADRWEVISYPAIATEDEKYRNIGEALHPERYNEKALAKKKRTMIPRHWSALYQQDPVAEEGRYFTKNMIRFYAPGDLPSWDKLNLYAAGDLAISKKESADYTVFVVVALDKDDNIWILDVYRDRWDTDELTDKIIEIHEIWAKVGGIRRFGIEREKIAIAIGPDLNRKIKKRKIRGLVIEDLHIAGRDGRARARLIQGRMAQGQVRIPAGALWVDQWVNEHLRYDSGVNDDCVDADAWIGQMLANENFHFPSGTKKKDKSWKEKLKGYTDGNKRANSHMAA